MEQIMHIYDHPEEIHESALVCNGFRPLKKMKPSLHSPYYAEACNEWQGPSPRLGARATQLRRNVAALASR